MSAAEIIEQLTGLTLPKRFTHTHAEWQEIARVIGLVGRPDSPHAQIASDIAYRIERTTGEFSMTCIDRDSIEIITGAEQIVAQGGWFAK